MTSMRLALISRRFWPLQGGAEIAMMWLARELTERGASCRVLTARGDHHWPAQFRHEGFDVVRLMQPAPRGWGTLRYMVTLARWLKQHQGHLDAVIVSTMRHDAYAAVRALRNREIPVVLRAESAGTSGAAAWFRQSHFGQRIQQGCQRADAVITVNEAARRELINAGFDPHRTRHIRSGVPIAMRPVRQAARAALAAANQDLTVDAGGKVVVAIGYMDSAHGMMELVDAFRRIATRDHRHRLWLIGDGPQRSALWQRIKNAELLGRVLMPGNFDDVEEIFAGADLFVAAGRHAVPTRTLQAMSNNVPVIVSDEPGNEELVRHGETGWRVPALDAAALAAALQQLLDDQPLAGRLAENALRHVAEHHALSTMADSHWSLLRELVSEKTA